MVHIVEMSNLKRKSITGVENLALNVHSDAETQLYWDENCSEESVCLSSDEFSPDTDASRKLHIASCVARVRHGLVGLHSSH